MAGKGGILALLASPKGKGGSKAPPAPMDDMGGEPTASEGATALREAFDLLKAGDDEAAWTAFKRAKAACDEEYEEPDSDDMGGLGEGEEDMDL